MCNNSLSHLVHHPYMKIKKEYIAMTKINPPITPSAPTLRDIPTPPEEKTYKLGKGQNLVLGLTSSLGSDPTANWGRQSADKLEDGGTGLFATNRNKETEVTYDANNDEANEITLGLTGNNLNEDTTTRINLDKNDVLRLTPTNTIASIESNDDGTVTVTFEEKVNNPNYNPQAPNQMSKWESATHTSIVTMPEESLEKITSNLSSEQKKQLGVADRTTLAERLRPETVKADDRYRIPQRNTEDRDRSNTYFNPEDKNKDGKLILSSKANRAKTYNLADNELEGSPNGKDVAQSLEIGELDPDFAGKKKLNINLGEKDSIADIPNSTVEQVSTDLEEGVTTLRLLQKNDNGGSRTITITLPEDSLEKAIENIPKEMQKTILEEAKKSEEASPLETDDSDAQDFRPTGTTRLRDFEGRYSTTRIPSLEDSTRTNTPRPTERSSELFQFSNKTLKLPKFENPAKPERTYQLGSNNMKLEPFDFNNASLYLAHNTL